MPSRHEAYTPAPPQYKQTPYNPSGSDNGPYPGQGYPYPGQGYPYPGQGYPQAIQFVNLNGQFDAVVVDPSGKPQNVLDIDLTFTVSGSIQLPNFLTGTGAVVVYADELGGPFDGPIGSQSVDLTGAVSPTDPSGLVTYPWSITVGPPTLPDPSPDSSIYQLAVSFAYQNPPGNHTDVGAVIDLGLFFII
jgi:hypothetical protein